MEGGDAERGGQRRRRMPRMKNPARLWRRNREQNHKNPEDQEEALQEEAQQEEAQQEEEALQEVSRRLISREEQLFSQDRPRGEDQDQLQKDFEDLKLHIWMAVHDTFTSSSSSAQRDLLRSAAASIQQQEVQDRRWADRSEDRVPVWRPLRWRSTHNALLQKMVESRLEAQEEELRETGLSSAVKREVCWRGRRVRDDLLAVARTVIGCYPPETDVLNVYAGLYHQTLSARLVQLAAAGAGAALDPDDCSYLLFWVNHHYPREVLGHQDLQAVKTACLGSLLRQEDLDRLEDQYLSHREDKVKLWLNTALKKEEELWLTGAAPELIDTFHFSPLAIDVIQVVDGSLTELTCVIRDQTQSQRITAHLVAFLSSYRKSLEEFVRGNHGNVQPVVQAQLVCEEQLRDYISGPTGRLSEQQRHVCLETLSALKDCGYRCLTCPIHTELKVCFKDLWTGAWLDGSRPVVPSLLDSVSRHLSPVLTHLKPSCAQSLLSVLHQDLVLHYVKRMMKSRMKSREQQVGGAQRMKTDAETMDDFFTQTGLGTPWSGQVLLSMAEVLRLQDPGSVQLEMVSLARTFPDLSDVHVSALLSLKTGLSAADVRSIRKSVEENRLLDVSTNHSPPFFSKVKVKWIHDKRNKMGL